MKALLTIGLLFVACSVAYADTVTFGGQTMNERSAAELVQMPEVDYRGLPTGNSALVWQSGHYTGSFPSSYFGVPLSSPVAVRIYRFELPFGGGFFTISAVTTQGDWHGVTSVQPTPHGTWVLREYRGATAPIVISP